MLFCKVLLSFGLAQFLGKFLPVICCLFALTFWTSLKTPVYIFVLLLNVWVFQGLILILFLSLGVAVSAFRLTKRQDVVKVNVRQNASLQWNYEVDAGESYSIVWGTSQDGVNVQHKLYTRIKGQTALRSAKIPTKFVDRVKIIKQATLFIQRVDLSDEGYYMCQISGEFLTNREPIRLEVIGECKILIFVFFELRAKPSAIRFSYKAIYVCNDQGRGPNCTLFAYCIERLIALFKALLQLLVNIIYHI